MHNTDSNADLEEKIPEFLEKDDGHPKEKGQKKKRVPKTNRGR